VALTSRCFERSAPIREPAPVSAADTGIAADYTRLRRSIKARGTGATLEAMLADIDG